MQRQRADRDLARVVRKSSSTNPWYRNSYAIQYNTIQYILLIISIGFLGNQFPCTRKVEKISRCVEN